MFLSHNYRKYVLLFLAVFLFTASPALSQKIQAAADVRGTLYIEPNNNPRAGESTQVLFTLTRKSGKAIPLAECNCKLDVYAEPHVPGEPALLEPPLQPVVTQSYQGVPSAKIIFPRAGTYQLQLKGKPISGRSFQPFVLKFDVDIAPGVEVVNNRSSGATREILIWVAAFLGLVLIGVFFILGQFTNRTRH